MTCERRTIYLVAFPNLVRKRLCEFSISWWVRKFQLKHFIAPKWDGFLNHKIWQQKLCLILYCSPISLQRIANASHIVTEYQFIFLKVLQGLTNNHNDKVFWSFLNAGLNQILKVISPTEFLRDFTTLMYAVSFYKWRNGACHISQTSLTIEFLSWWGILWDQKWTWTLIKGIIKWIIS